MTISETAGTSLGSLTLPVSNLGSGPTTDRGICPVVVRINRTLRASTPYGADSW